MKINIQRCLVTAIVLLASLNSSSAQTVSPGDVRSSASGNWSNAATGTKPVSIWEKYRSAYGGWKVRSAADVGADSINMRKPGYNATAWLKATVPGTIFGDHVDAGLEADPRVGDNILKIDATKYNRKFWYRTEFAVPADYSGKRIWLNFNGINKISEIYINNTRLGALKGFMQRGRYDVTKLVNKTGVNVVAILIYPMGDNFNNLEMPSYMGANGWDWTPKTPGKSIGISDKVYLSASEDVTILDPWIRTKELLSNNTSAKLAFTTGLKNHSDKAQSVVFTAIVSPGNFKISATIPLAAKEFKTIAPADMIMSNVKLWWPNGYGDPNLYNIKLVCSVNGKVSDSTSFKFGIRKYGYTNDKNGVLNIYINGKRVFVKGGNWGMSDFMLKVRGEDYDARVRFHKEMNMNMIRTWIGCVTDEEFYDYCDKYGIMIWDDFWLNNRFTFLNDEKMFLSNVPEKLKRFRNHAAIAVWCGANENVPFQDIQLQDSTLKYDGGDRLYQSSSSGQNIVSTNIKVQFGMKNQGGLSGSGPWNNLDPSAYYSSGVKRGNSTEKTYVGTWGFRSELGAASFPNVESFKKFMPADKLWPRNDVWSNPHYFSDDWAYGGGALPGDYMNRISNNYGASAGIEDFTKKAQLINLETHRAMYEGFLDHMWNDASGLLLWMSQSAYPTMIWQTYDYYLDCTGSYYGIKKACEPVHIQCSYANNDIKIVNTTHTTLNNLTAKVTLYNSDGSPSIGQTATKTINALKDTTTYCFNAYGNALGSNNLALNKPTTASGQETNNPKERAVDGVRSTRWASGSSANDTWIYVDLGAPTSISAVNLVWESYAKSYKIQVSNNATTWTDVYSTTTGNGGDDEITFPATTARYVKMQGVEKAGFFGLSLYEFGVYAQAPSPLSALHFIKLELKDSEGKLISENLYWRSSDNKYLGLNALPKVALTVTSTTENLGTKKLMRVKLVNPANAAGVAFGVHVQLRNATTNERVLPAIISDNYFTILKGEEKIVTIEYDPALLKGAAPKLDVAQYSNQPELQPLGNNIQSPDGKTNFSLYVANNRLQYKVDYNGKTVIETSPLVLSVNNKLTNEVTGIDPIKKKIIDETYPVRGVHSQGRNYCTDAEVNVKGNGASNFKLQVRVFNDGVAFRYVLPLTGSNTINADSTVFSIPTGAALWSQGDINSYEGTYERRVIDNVSNSSIGPPLTMKLADNAGYLSITEGGVTDFAGMSLRVTTNRKIRAAVKGITTLTGPISTPWRVIQIGSDLNTLVNCDIINSVSEKPDPALFPNGFDADWLQPGKSVWSWMTDNDGSLFAVNPPVMRRFSKAAGDLGFTYNLVDEGWAYWKETGKDN
ncbi:MAG: hypothetical protein EOP47_15185, partial [Sphingobacteriaceae bacterium]